MSVWRASVRLFAIDRLAGSLAQPTKMEWSLNTVLVDWHQPSFMARVLLGGSDVMDI